MVDPPPTDTPRESMRIVKRIKITVAAIAGLLAVIIMFQNTQDVQARLLFWEFSAPFVLLLLMMLAAGLIVGAIGMSIYHRRQARR